MERFYDPAHWAHAPQWVLHEHPDQEWYRLPAIQIIPGLAPQILFIPLVGHTPGHCGVAIKTDEGWLLHCGFEVESLASDYKNRPVTEEGQLILRVRLKNE